MLSYLYRNHKNIQISYLYTAWTRLRSCPRSSVALRNSSLSKSPTCPTRPILRFFGYIWVLSIFRCLQYCLMNHGPGSRHGRCSLSSGHCTCTANLMTAAESQRVQSQEGCSWMSKQVLLQTGKVVLNGTEHGLLGDFALQWKVEKEELQLRAPAKSTKRASTRHIAVQHLFFLDFFTHFLRKLLWLETNHWSRQTRMVLEVSVPCQHQCLQFLSDQLQNSALRTATDCFLCSNVQKRSFPELR